MKEQKRPLTIAGLAVVIGLSLAMLTPFSASALSFSITAPVGDQPVALAISPDDTTLFVANAAAGTISVMDVTPPSEPIQRHLYDLRDMTGWEVMPSALALSSDGNTLFVADSNTDHVYELDVSDPANPLLVWSETVGTSPSALALSSDDRQLVVANDDASLSVLTIAVGFATATVAGPYYIPGHLADPSLQALSPIFGEGGSAGLIVADGVDSVWIFDTADFTALPAQVVVGDSPRSVAFVPMFSALYVAGETTLQVVLPDLSVDLENVFTEAGNWSVVFSPDYSYLSLLNSTGGYIEFQGMSGSESSAWNEALGTDPTRVIFSHDGTTAFAVNSGSDTISIIGLDAKKLEPTPSGSLLATTDISLPLSPQFMNLVTEDDPEEGDHWLAGRGADCGLEVGWHPYSTQNVTVTVTGIYTFRVVGTTPDSLDESPDVVDTPIRDPFLAVYSAFDPLFPDTGVVGCDDDRGVRGDSRQRVDAVTGTTYDEQWSYFTTTLEPGTYDLVLTTYGSYDAAEWSETDPELRWWDPQILTASFELWGPTGGLTVTDVGPSRLAKTGSPTGTWSLAAGVLALLAGTTVLTVTRKRRPKRAIR